MIGEPTTFWGKLAMSPDGRRTWHPVVGHCADVAACCAALLRDTALGARLAHVAGRAHLDDHTVDRLSALAAMHDLGKFGIGFQNKSLVSPPFASGHVREVLTLFPDRDGPHHAAFRDALPVAELCEWSEREGAIHLLIAAICHHGKPHRADGISDARHWSPARGLDPFVGMRDLVTSARRWFPRAFTSGGPELPSSPAFQHAFAGLVMLADWLGSDTDFFPYALRLEDDRFAQSLDCARRALRATGLDANRARAGLDRRRPAFEIVSPFAPNEAQRRVADLPATPGVALLEAETGSGKTEAALARFVTLLGEGAVDGMYFALPTRTAATQIFERVRRAVERAFQDETERPPVVLAVPGYLRVDDREGARLAPFEVLWNDDPHERYRYRGWAAEHPKRYLASAIAVGTIDQVLLSSLTVGHAHMRATALSRQLLVVDEVHASDAYMTRLLEEVLRVHASAGGHAFLMSATLGSVAKTRLLRASGVMIESATLAQACTVPYPVVTYGRPGRAAMDASVQAPGRPKEIDSDLVSEQDDATALAVRAVELAGHGAHVLILRNTVRDAIATQQAIEAIAGPGSLFTCNGVIAPHHARYAREDRVALDQAIERAFGKERGLGACIVVATQTVQQSLDLDADVLLTDLCPVDVLLQRMGRLQRHVRERPRGFERARCYVLIGAKPLIEQVRSNGTVRGGHGYGTVYEDLRMLACTERLLASRPTWRIPADNRDLVERATHPEALSVLHGEDARWDLHGRVVAGETLGERRIASLNLVDRGVPFGEASFGDRSRDERISTRLGEGDRLLELPSPIQSPFGASIARLTVPAWLARGIAENASLELTPHDGGFALLWGDRRFVYDRLGLRAEDE